MNSTKNKKKKVTLKTYVVGWAHADNDGYTGKESVLAKSEAAARYRWFVDKHMDWLDYKDVFKAIKVYSQSSCKPEDFFGSEREFKRMQEHRGLQFAHMGMKVSVGGKPGVITGSNHSFNLNVWFDGTEDTYANCHPHSNVVYFRPDGSILKSYQ